MCQLVDQPLLADQPVDTSYGSYLVYNLVKHCPSLTEPFIDGQFRRKCISLLGGRTELLGRKLCGRSPKNSALFP